jgi:hypothetical protein
LPITVASSTPSGSGAAFPQRHFAPRRIDGCRSRFIKSYSQPRRDFERFSAELMSLVVGASERGGVLIAMTLLILVR